MNIEHRTLNVQHRIVNSVNLKKTEQAYSAEVAAKASGESTLRNSIRLPSTSSGPEHVEGSCSILGSQPNGSSQAAVRLR